MEKTAVFSAVFSTSEETCEPWKKKDMSVARGDCVSKLPWIVFISDNNHSMFISERIFTEIIQIWILKEIIQMYLATWDVITSVKLWKSLSFSYTNQNTTMEADILKDALKSHYAF